MGFLIFAYRKLTLRRRIDQHQFRLIQLSNEISRVQEESSIMQQATAARQDMAKQSMSMTADNFYSQKRMQMLMLGGALSNSEAGLANIFAKVPDKQHPETDSDYRKALENHQTLMKASEAFQNFNMFDLQRFQNDTMNKTQMINSIFHAQDEGALRGLKTRETRLNQEKESLESLLKKEEAEYQSVEKAEDNEAKRCAPKFGLS